LSGGNCSGLNSSICFRTTLLRPLRSYFRNIEYIRVFVYITAQYSMPYCFNEFIHSMFLCKEATHDAMQGVMAFLGFIEFIAVIRGSVICCKGYCCCNTCCCRCCVKCCCCCGSPTPEYQVIETNIQINNEFDR
jgi:hypothetical protein